MSIALGRLRVTAPKVMPDLVEVIVQQPLAFRLRHTPQLFPDIGGVTELILSPHDIHESETILPLNHENLGLNIDKPGRIPCVLTKLLGRRPCSCLSNPAKDKNAVTRDWFCALAEGMSSFSTISTLNCL
jgi:hypothetical protein